VTVGARASPRDQQLEDCRTPPSATARARARAHRGRELVEHLAALVRVERVGVDRDQARAARADLLELGLDLREHRARSRCTTHTLMPSAPSRFAVASPKPLEPPRITAH
jgi:hypothetical protein